MTNYLKRFLNKKRSAQNLNFFLIISVLAAGIPALAYQVSEGSMANNAQNTPVFESLVIMEENTLIASANPSQPEQKTVKSITAVITAYSSTPQETDSTPFITASNTRTRDGVIANNLLPFGTKIRIPELYGNKVFTVEDRMNARMGDHRFDIWFPSHAEAKNFGVKKTLIEIVEV